MQFVPCDKRKNIIENGDKSVLLKNQKLNPIITGNCQILNFPGLQMFSLPLSILYICCVQITDLFYTLKFKLTSKSPSLGISE